MPPRQAANLYLLYFYFTLPYILPYLTYLTDKVDWAKPIRFFYALKGY